MQRKIRRRLSRWISDDQIQRKRTPSFRATSPLSRGTLKSKGCGKLSIHFCADGDTIETVFRTIISVNQLSIYGAVSDLCGEYSACQARTRRPVLPIQCDPLFEPASLLMTTLALSTEDSAQENLLQKYKERVERLSQHDRLVKICIGAGFLKTVEVGQYFMTKDTEEFSQFTEPVTCREYTLPRDEKSTDPKGWIRGNTKIGPVFEVTTSYLQGKYGVEIRTESVNKDNSHSWVRISHGLNKLVTDLSNKEHDDNELETSETKSEEFALKTEVFAFACRSKAKAKPPLLAHLQELYLFVKEFGLILSQETEGQKDCEGENWEHRAAFLLNSTSEMSLMERGHFCMSCSRRSISPWGENKRSQRSFHHFDFHQWDFTDRTRVLLYAPLTWFQRDFTNDHNCGENPTRTQGSLLGFLFIFHWGRRPRRVVAYLWRFSSAWSARAELCGDCLRWIHCNEALVDWKTHSTFTSGRKSVRSFIVMLLMEKRPKLNEQLRCAHIRWRSMCAKGVPSVDSECNQASRYPRLKFWLIWQPSPLRNWWLHRQR